MIKKYILLGLISCLSTVAMAWSGAQPIDITLQASAQVNLNAAKHAAPLPVSLFVLRDAKDFNKANYFALEEGARRALGSDLLLAKSKVLLPGKQTHLQFNATDDARYIGIIAGYSNLKGKRWRKVIALSQLKKADLKVNFNTQGIATTITTRASQAHSGWYSEGGLAFGLPSVTSDTFSYSAGTTSTLINNKASTYGELAIGLGYQWLRGDGNWLDTLHLEKFSLGAGFAFSPINKINGDVINLINPIPRAYKLDVSSQMLTLEGKINFLRFSNFTTFINLGVGMARYATRYQRTLVGGVDVSTSNNNISPVYSAGLGLEYDYDDELGISFGYEYRSPTEIKIEETMSGTKPALTSPTLTLENSQIFVKFRYLFKG